MQGGTGQPLGPSRLSPPLAPLEPLPPLPPRPQVRAHAVIVATGATAKRLGLPSEQQFWSAGISACAICDGASHMFKGQELAVVGGGDTATEEALYLTKYGSHVSWGSAVQCVNKCMRVGGGWGFVSTSMAAP